GGRRDLRRRRVKHDYQPRPLVAELGAAAVGADLLVRQCSAPPAGHLLHLTPPSLDGPGLCLRLLLRLRYVVFDPFESTQVRLPASHTYLPHRDAVSQADRRYPHPHLRANPQRLLALRGRDDPGLQVAPSPAIIFPTRSTSTFVTRMRYPCSGLIVLSYFSFRRSSDTSSRGDPNLSGGTLTTSARLTSSNITLQERPS